RRHRKTNRIVTHDLWRDDIYHSGLMPFPHEWQYDCPDQIKSEDLFIYGVNSSKQSIYIAIKWRPKGADNQIDATISLRFDDNNSNSYTLEEDSAVDFRPNEYRVGGLRLEISSPFRRKRITFRGYLTKNGNQLVYARFRFLWYALSRVYDFHHDFDDQFMAKEMALSSKSDKSETRFENRFEQFGQLKGQFTEGPDGGHRQLYLWGSAGKKYLHNTPINRDIHRCCGYTKDGIGFHLGFVCDKSGNEYRFGYLFDKSGHFLRLKALSLKGQDFSHILGNNLVHFKATFGERDYDFVIEKHGNCLAKRLLVNGSEGMCYVLQDTERHVQQWVQTYKSVANESSLVLGLHEENAQRVDINGGKGSSLAVLMSLSQVLVNEKYKKRFHVPNGVIVTANAYRHLLREYTDLSQYIRELEESTQWSGKELITKCDHLMNTISSHKLPEVIKQEIEAKLRQNFADFETKLFAVRSSAVSEDSAEMSAAGQMTTYLGVRGLEGIYSSVMKCWSSQFSGIAVAYKRGYGQSINGPMAVVIQEMIDCQSAGVMFTCDPITGDEGVLEVTANYGLGESVVSGSSEPDTIHVSVDIESNSLSARRRVKAIDSKAIGQKKTSVRLSESGGTVVEEAPHGSGCCVTDEDVMRLADIGLQIHKHYGHPVDIEWGLQGGQIYALQARPVTNLDNRYTDYEIMHEMDSSHPTESEIHTRAHCGTTFPGATSWTALQWSWANKSQYMVGLLSIIHIVIVTYVKRMDVMKGTAIADDYNPYVDTMGVAYNQLMFSLTNGTRVDFSDYPDTAESKQMVLSFFGHHFEDQDVLNAFKRNPNNSWLESDYNLLIASCNDVISADAPNSLREIATTIKDKHTFRQLTDEEALQVLANGSDESSIRFRHFLDIHGHRGYREADPMHHSWKENPIPCVQTIKGLLSGNKRQLEPKVVKSVDQAVDELKTPLSPLRRLLLKKLILPWVQRGVGHRELSKHFNVFMTDMWKQGFRLLARQMVAEGLIPFDDHFFYLTVNEVDELCIGRRNPLILTRVRHRRRLYKQMDGYKFDEFIKGPEMRPRNLEKRTIASTLGAGMVQMKGTPVSEGYVKARVCVADGIADADNILPGDILVTYSTDIGWSPYFPLLSGIVTEIGGTISHGAVIAREYGVPCLVAVEDVCQAVKTGDICVLDTNARTLTKVE
ncbi:unnamed protein product, partial [Oppiella nova]